MFFRVAVSALCLSLLLAQISLAQTQFTTTHTDRQSINVTVYNSNIGLVRETRRLTLPAGRVALRFAVSLLEASDFRVAKEFVINGQPRYYLGYNNPGQAIKEKVGVYMQFRNSQQNRLGVPIPGGTIRLYKKDQNGNQQFIGEDRITHTPKDEDVRVKVGDAFDIVAERKQTDYKVIAPTVYEYAYEIKIRNHKSDAVTLIVNEPIGGDWEILSSSREAEKTAAFAARFRVPVAKDGEAKLTYRVRVRY